MRGVMPEWKKVLSPMTPTDLPRKSSPGSATWVMPWAMPMLAPMQTQECMAS